MDLIREKLKDPKVTGIGGLVVGLVLGWFVIGWGIWPVEWTDALPEHLNAQEKEEYLRMAIDSYAIDQDPIEAQQRYQSLKPGAEEAWEAIEANPGEQAPYLLDFAMVALEETAAEPMPEEEVLAEETPEEAEEEGPNLTLLFVMCGVTLLIGGALAAYFLLRPGRGQRQQYSPAAEAQRVSHETEPTDFGVREGIPPMSQFMTTYMVGDDLFDDSFVYVYI